MQWADLIKMKKIICFWFLVLLAAETVTADTQLVFGNLDGQLLATGAGRVVKLDQKGNELWSCKGANVSDVWLLPNGNVLFADKEAKEINPVTGTIVWRYKAEFDKGGGVFGVQRLENGNTLVAENSTGRILEVDYKGDIV